MTLKEKNIFRFPVSLHAPSFRGWRNLCPHTSIWQSPGFLIRAYNTPAPGRSPMRHHGLLHVFSELSFTSTERNRLPFLIFPRTKPNVPAETPNAQMNQSHQFSLRDQQLLPLLEKIKTKPAARIPRRRVRWCFLSPKP